VEEMKMFKIALAIASLAFLSITAISQTPEELARLRERLNLPPATIILSSGFSRLPAEIPLKIYLASGRDEKVNKRFVKWIPT
jgi:hypothetical protein